VEIDAMNNSELRVLPYTLYDVAPKTDLQDILLKLDADNEAFPTVIETDVDVKVSPKLFNAETLYP
jgi:hypothetical protein